MNSLNSKLIAVAASVVSTMSIASAQSTDHIARIPARSDVSSIRFQGVKMVTLPASGQIVKDERYCAQAALRDPGGSAYCPAVQQGFERMYQVTYSYIGGPMASDEYGNTRHTFSVYFRPDELGSAEKAVLVHKGSHADAAGSFELTLLKEFEERQVVDQNNSAFCQGTYADGAWVHTDSKCQDNLQIKTVMAPSDYIAVRVDLASAKGVLAAE